MNLLDILNLLRGKANTAFNDRIYGDLEMQNKWAQDQLMQARAKAPVHTFSDSRGYDPQYHMAIQAPSLMNMNLRHRANSELPNWSRPDDSQDLQEVIHKALRERFNDLQAQRKQM